MATKNVTASQVLIWRAGKKPLLRLDGAADKIEVVPTRCTAGELESLATAAKEAVRVMREMASKGPSKSDPAIHGSVHGSRANGNIAGETGEA